MSSIDVEHCNDFSSISTPNLDVSERNLRIPRISKRFRSQSWCPSIKHRRRSVSVEHRNECKLLPFNLRWVEGRNVNVPVVNLTKFGKPLILYSATNTSILYDYEAQQMRLLQGHQNDISDISVDLSGKWLATADSGKDNTAIVWDCDTQTPLRIIYPAEGRIISKIAISLDGKYLIIMYDEPFPQLSLWIWTSLDDNPTATAVIKEKHPVREVRFDPEDSNKFCVVCRDALFFGKINRGEITFHKPLMTDKAFTFGNINSAVHIPNCGQVICCTSNGFALVFGQTVEFQMKTQPDIPIRYVKMLKIDSKPLNVIRCFDGTIVTGNDIGDVRFYDYQMKILFWIQNFEVGSIQDISCNKTPKKYTLIDPMGLNGLNGCETCLRSGVDDESENLFSTTEELYTLPLDATIKRKPFIVRDFIISTKTEGICVVSFLDGKCRIVVHSTAAHITALTVHPDKTLICIGYNDGVVKLMNYLTHTLFARMSFPWPKQKLEMLSSSDESDDEVEKLTKNLDSKNNQVSCLQFSPSGAIGTLKANGMRRHSNGLFNGGAGMMLLNLSEVNHCLLSKQFSTKYGLHLACGVGFGYLWFLDPLLLEPKLRFPMQDSKNIINNITFSDDSMYMAYSDLGKVVCLYGYECIEKRWEFIGKHCAHYKPIASVIFPPNLTENGYPKLLSFGQDRILVEYDVESSSDEYLVILSQDRIDQTAIPLTACCYSTKSDKEKERNLIFMTTDEYKIKVLNFGTGMTLGTFLGPRYDSPVNQICVPPMRNSVGHPKWIIFATDNHIGIQMLPLDGNPYKHVGMLCHPHKINKFVLSLCGKILFTTGLNDSTLYQWNINFRAVDISCRTGGDKLNPYYCLIEGGPTGWLFQEMRDLFYYIQMLCQGKRTPVVRRVSDTIPIDTLPDLMRALGFYPSEYEVENLIKEAKYKLFHDDVCDVCESIEFEDVVKLYLNHRPAFGESIVRLKKAFELFAKQGKSDNKALKKDDLLSIFTDKGENFSEDLTLHLLKILAVQFAQFNDNELGLKGDSFSFVPEDITYKDFTENILGINFADVLPDDAN